MQEEDKRFEFVLVAKVLKLLLFTVVVAIVVVIVCVILNVCVCLVYLFSARVKCLSSELRIPPFILFISNELLKTYTWQKVKEEGEFLSFRHVGFFIL